MLTELRARNIAIIDELKLDFGPGLSVLSGETGAGKSLILASMSMLCGRKAGTEIIRQGTPQAEVSGVFDLSLARVDPELLVELGLEPDETLLSVQRTITESGGQKKDVVRIAGTVSSLKMLRRSAGALLDLASQHEQVRLLDREQQILLLDRFAAAEDQRAQVGLRWKQWRDSQAALADLQEKRGHAAERMDWLGRAVSDIKALKPRTGEETELAGTISGLAHALELGEALQGAIFALKTSETDLVSGLQETASRLAGAKKWLPALEESAARLEAASIELSDVAFELERLCARVEPDPVGLDAMQERLAKLQRAFSRYSCSDSAGLLSIQDSCAAELLQYEDMDGLLAEATKTERESHRLLLAEAERLHALRARAATKLGKEVQRHLADLAMEKARFVVEVVYAPEEKLSPAGADAVTFKLAANPGSEPQDLSFAASGGELSRLLLAIKTVLSEAYPVPVFIFDEIDAGIGGATARELGRKLCGLASRSQVICVTHLAQIAIYADRHYVIEKESRSGNAFLTVRTIDGSQRQREVARMLSGNPESETAAAHAAELLLEAEKEKDDWKKSS